MTVTICYRVYGADGHSQKESYNDSYRFNFSSSHEGTRIIEVHNYDETGTHDYSEVYITRNTYYECDEEMQGQLTDDIFENHKIGKVTEVFRFNHDDYRILSCQENFDTDISKTIFQYVNIKTGCISYGFTNLHYRAVLDGVFDAEMIYWMRGQKVHHEEIASDLLDLIDNYSFEMGFVNNEYFDEDEDMDCIDSLHNHAIDLGLYDVITIENDELVIYAGAVNMVDWSGHNNGDVRLEYCTKQNPIDNAWRYSVYEGESGGIVFALSEPEALRFVKDRYNLTKDVLDKDITDEDIQVWLMKNDDYYDQRFPNVFDCYGF